MTKYYVALLYVLFSLQTLSLYSVGNVNLKIYHVTIAIIALVAFPRLVVDRRLRELYGYLVIMLSWGLIGYIFYDVSYLYLNYIFCLVLVLTWSSIVRRAQYEEVISGLQWGALMIAIFTCVNLYLNIDGIRAAHVMEAITGARASMSFLLYGGGINLEASWIALASAFFLRNGRVFLFYILLSFTIDYALTSRAGFIATALILFIWVFRELRGRDLAKNAKVIKSGLILSCALVAASLIVIFADFILSGSIFQRFANIGNEPGSLGRLNMWVHVWDAIVAQPIWGYGLGNAVVGISTVGFVGGDGNVHNYIFQHLIEVGVVGLIAWLVLSVSILRQKDRPEMRVYFAVFFIISLIQFRGAEVMLYFVFASLLVSRLTINDGSYFSKSFSRG